jgi:hypothetical protein
LATSLNGSSFNADSCRTFPHLRIDPASPLQARCRHERGSGQYFLLDFCRLLGLEERAPPVAENALNA